MLSFDKSVRSTKIIIDMIRELSGDTNFVMFDATVSASINGKQKIDKEIIRVHLTNSRPNYASIDIMWEDYGYKNYRDMGLYGHMTTQYQEVIKINQTKLRIIDKNYQIEISN